MIWIARIIFGLLLLLFIKKRPNLSFFLGVGLLIIYLCAISNSSNDIDTVKNNNLIEQKYGKTPKVNYLNKQLSSKPKSSSTNYYYQKDLLYDNSSIEKGYKKRNYNQSRTIKKDNRIRVGAVCNDGTTSNATGRGACSHHGGVAYWLVE
ncbi:hypothetical protein [Galbibacter sp.]|uniref:hypothetical protein n=1 Tax=Galbibacter sp. TaxID=2918471 RepID=UPI002C1427FD|nr:hypothetical protein [Galbibacter sp.]HLV64128.1 hypothetical protein [Galbibacter sp.]